MRIEEQESWLFVTLDEADRAAGLDWHSLIKRKIPENRRVYVPELDTWIVRSSYRRLVEALFVIYREVGKARAEMELRVEERTAELMAANEQLRQEMAKRKRAEQEVVRVERLRALDEMSIGISHNLNNILTGIMGPAQFIQSLTDDREIREYAEVIVQSAERAADLIRRLRHSVRSSEAEESLEPVAVNTVAQNAVLETRSRWKDEAEAGGISIEVITEFGDIPPVRGTETGLRDILVNLLLNAIDALPRGGAITIRTQAVEEGVQLRVSDTGIGMDEEVKRRIFEPLFTTKKDVGSGLGLSTAYGAVARWGGSIDVESSPGEGAAFRILLPVWTEPEGEE